MNEGATPYLLQGKGKKTIVTISICLALLNVTGCDFVYNKIYPDFKANKQKTVVEAPPFAREEISIEKVRDVAQKIDKNDTDFTVNPIAVKSENLNLDILQEPESTQSHLLFKDVTLSHEERFTRLEKTVQKLSDILQRMEPSVTKLLDIESELDALTFQLEKIVNKNKQEQNSQNNIQAIAPAATQEIKQEIKTIAVDNTSTTTPLIHKVRLGDHKGKARIVIETAEKLAYDLKLNGNTATITFPQGRLSDKTSLSARGSQLVQSIQQNTANDGATALQLNLTKTSKILKQFRMSPDKDVRSNQRIVIDLAR